MIAALYVATGGCYFGLPDVDPWNKDRDARLYAGPHPVVAHPPCERWGRYWGGSPTTFPRLKKGDDGGCFRAALDAVRAWGGVLEHPEGSHAWRAFGLNLPPRAGGWVNADFTGGWTCCVEQGWYGHRARKATWLYYCGDIPPRRTELGPRARQLRQAGSRLPFRRGTPTRDPHRRVPAAIASAARRNPRPVPRPAAESRARRAHKACRMTRIDAARELILLWQYLLLALGKAAALASAALQAARLRYRDACA